MEPSIVFGAPLLWAKSSGGTSRNLSWDLGLEVMEVGGEPEGGREGREGRASGGGGRASGGGGTAVGGGGGRGAEGMREAWDSGKIDLGSESGFC